MSNNKDIPILIADDDPVMRQLLSSILRSEGYSRLQQVNDGQQALNVLKAPGSDIGIAFLDISMPAFSGLEVMRMSKAALPHCFFVIVSAHSALDNVLAAVGDGARGFVVKPFTAQKIHDVLKKLDTATAP
jgi:two-component system chemotaxis response regulator CheY